MSGQYAIKGYLIQTLVAILDSFNDSHWISVSVEPNGESEKVDICWIYEDGTKKVMQVKSSKNPFELYATRKWAKELENGSLDASEHILYLVGRIDDKIHSLENNKIGAVLIKNIDLPINELNALILGKINTFFESKGKNPVNQNLGKLFSLSLNQEFLLNSTFGKILVRSEFEQELLNGLIAIEKYLEKSAYSLLLPPESIVDEDIKKTIIKHILHLIGWNNLNENELVTIRNDRLSIDEDFSVEYWSNYKSRLKDNEQDVIYINSLLEAEYPIDIYKKIQHNGYCVDLIREKLIKKGSIKKIETTEHSIQFLLSTMESDLNRNLFNEIKSFYKSNNLNKDIVYYAIDNNKANFIISSIITARGYRPELYVKFLYPITEENSTVEKIGKRNTYLPPQYINSSIIPIIKEDKSKISVLLFCSDPYDKNRLRKLIWMLIRLTSGLANEYIIYFPDFLNEFQNEVNEVIRSYEDDELIDKLQVQQLKMCETTELSTIPSLQENLIDESFDESNNEKKRVTIQPHLIEYLPYGDSLKPFLASDAVLAPELKMFLSKKGIYFKTADKTRIIHLMTGLLLSPLEIESLVELIEVKDRALSSNTVTYPLLDRPGNAPFLIKSEIFDFQEVSKDLKADLLSPIEFTPTGNANEFVAQIQIEQINPNKQAMVSSVYSTAKVTARFNYETKKFEIEKEYNSKPARVLVDRIEKIICNQLINSNVIEEKSSNITFSNFNNKDRVNFLLSFTNIESSEIFTNYNAKSFKYMFDERLNLPLEYQDKIGKENIIFSKGKNLDQVKELQDESFKQLILCEEIAINYKFNIRGVLGNFFVLLNFSDALKNKISPDGLFQYKGTLYLDSKNKAKINSISTIEKELKQEFRRLQKEKLEQFNISHL